MADDFLAALGNRFKKRPKARRWASPLLMAHQLEGLAMPAHQRYIDDHLVALEQPDGGDRLAISLPPQHGKSTLTTIWYVLWLLDGDPDLRIAVVCYNSDFAAHFGYETKQLIDKHSATLGWQVAPDSKANNLWRVKGHRGGCMYLGVGGSITGWPVDRVINDDWIKNHEDGFNPAAHEKNWVFHEGVIEQRLQDGVKEIACMTRWSDIDLIGKLLATAPGKWEVVNLPAKAEEDDPLGRAPGEGLWLGKNRQQWYDEKEDKLSSFIWAGLYQQRPSPEGGGILKKAHFRYFDDVDPRQTADGKERWHLQTGEYVIPTDCTRFGIADTATSTRTSADWTVLGAFAVSPAGDLLLFDLVRTRIEEDGQADLLASFMFRNRLPWFGVEATFATSDLAYQLGRMGVRFMPIKADADKLQRALPLRTRMEQHRFHFMAGAPWLSVVENEFLTFTGKGTGGHDDCVDVCAYAARHLDTTAAGGLGQKRVAQKKRRSMADWHNVGSG